MNDLDHTFEELRIRKNDKLRVASLADDYFQYVSGADDAAGSGVVLPETLQVVSLFKDGERKFKGHATKIIPGIKQVTVRIDGPWYWMKKINLSGDFLPPFEARMAAGARWRNGTTTPSPRRRYGCR